MSSTHLSLHYHIIFGTKHHEPLIVTSWESRLHAYLGGIVEKVGGFSQIINGVADHVHLLIGLSATHCLSETLNQVKTGSSRWVHTEVGFMDFAWQEGYGAFTVSPSQRQTVFRYIAGQKEHHKTQTFRDEYLKFLKRSGVAYDERYL